MICIACGNTFQSKKSIVVTNEKVNKDYTINFCECGLGKTDLENDSININEINYSDVIDRIAIYYHQLHNHYKIRIAQTVKEIKKHVSGLNLLEVGGNIGFVANEFKKHGYDVTNCELNEKCRTFSELVYDIKVEQDFFKITNKYDIVTLLDVLEHFEDPKIALEQAKSVLNSNGVIFIQLPNAESVTSKRLREKWDWWSPPDHTYHFTTDTLKRVCENTGFKIVHCETYNLIEDFRIFNWLSSNSKTKLLKLLYSNPFYYPLQVS